MERQNRAMISIEILPHLNATLNSLTTVLLLVGFVLARSGKHGAHRFMMISAIAVSSIFLTSYLIYHFTTPIFLFRGEGAIRVVYYIIMVSHVILALAVVPMIVMTALLALIGNRDRHRRIAYWTLPVWLYVSVSGVAVYYLLYHRN